MAWPTDYGVTNPLLSWYGAGRDRYGDGEATRAKHSTFPTHVGNMLQPAGRPSAAGRWSS
jgi:hypothetical protein